MVVSSSETQVCVSSPGEVSVDGPGEVSVDDPQEILQLTELLEGVSVDCPSFISEVTSKGEKRQNMITH